MLEGHIVEVVRADGTSFTGNLVHHDSTGVLVHDTRGLNNDRRFFPYSTIIEIKDKGRAP